jgi:nucleoside-diphosphate-sugar epimerase
MPDPVVEAESPGSEPALDEFLSRPTPALIEFIRSVSSPLLILGAGGKMGPTLAWLAHRAAVAAGHRLEVIATSRFAPPAKRAWFEERGIRTAVCEVFDPGSLDRLPDVEDILYLVGLKFGTAANPAATWATSTLAPVRVCERYPRARMVALSSGNVYPLSEVRRGGSVETDSLTPLGEYANAAVGRERMFEFCAARQGTRVALLRLFYAVELRYGVLVDLARKVQSGEPIDLANGAFNCIWQGDANERILRALALATSPPSVWNLCRPEVLSVRTLATQFGERLGRAPRFRGTEAATSLLGNAAKFGAVMGEPPVSVAQMMDWIVDWIRRGGRDLGRPTHFEERNGVY